MPCPEDIPVTGRRPGRDLRRESYAIISAVIHLAHALKLDTVAEGIETLAQAETLHGLGCDHGQGFLLGRPAPS
ncbi:EAL domain-containing protein (plasmid) [Rhodococcus antarcticus]|uniref:EAL domain-containing protein n=1 Tax=Rhodococcus antarcticus TaxID=2987751 RepID=A0ABY6P6W3_9NOCA|nr:EAL domain-containing protein [Rhodococcus antarcticus]UZJ26858.1 EAL domain-containing protein [Rhodococcus antarcticus]